MVTLTTTRSSDDSYMLTVNSAYMKTLLLLLIRIQLLGITENTYWHYMKTTVHMFTNAWSTLLNQYLLLQIVANSNKSLK